MPQPFKRHKTGPIEVGPPALISRPELAAEIAHVASRWVDLESAIGSSYSVMLFGDEPSAFATFYRLKTLELRKEAFMAVAEEKLPPGLLTKYVDLFRKIRKRATERNDIVHGTWCAIEEKKEALLLCDPKDISKRITRLCKLHCDGKPYTKEDISIAPDTFMVYTKKDFENTQERIAALTTEAAGLFGKVLALGLEAHARPKKRG